MRAPRRVKAGLQRLVERILVRRLIFWRGSSTRPQIAVTFDDGPDGLHTPQVLEILAEHAARATFFVLGRCVLQNPDLLRRILAAGHEVGAHGYDHSRHDLSGQMQKTVELLWDLGAKTSLIRPPGGLITADLLIWAARRRMPVCLWSLDAEDSMRHEGKRSARPAFHGMSAGEIVLFHDDNPVCLTELPAVLSQARDRGLGQVTVSQLLRP